MHKTGCMIAQACNQHFFFFLKFNRWNLKFITSWFQIYQWNCCITSSLFFFQNIQFSISFDPASHELTPFASVYIPSLIISLLFLQCAAYVLRFMRFLFLIIAIVMSPEYLRGTGQFFKCSLVARVLVGWAGCVSVCVCPPHSFISIWI